MQLLNARSAVLLICSAAFWSCSIAATTTKTTTTSATTTTKATTTSSTTTTKATTTSVTTTTKASTSSCTSASTVTSVSITTATSVSTTTATSVSTATVTSVSTTTATSVSTATVTSVSTATASPTPSCNQVIQNPGFENAILGPQNSNPLNGGLYPWTVVAGSGAGIQTCDQSPSGCYGGSQIFGGVGSASIVQSVNMCPGDTTSFQLYAMTNATYCDLVAYLDSTVMASTFFTSGGWQQLTQGYFAGPPFYATLQINITCYPLGTTNSFWLDNIILATAQV